MLLLMAELKFVSHVQTSVVRFLFYREVHRIMPLIVFLFFLQVFGTIRVPLYTMANEYSGLPAFLNNKFIGIAKQQLLLALYQQKIMPESEITEVLYKSQNYKLAPSRV